jgi:glutaminyl-tRNA synthetase
MPCRLRVADPSSVKGFDYRDLLNHESLEVLSQAMVEPGLADARPGMSFQFERLGYFCVDSKESQQARLVFNRSVTLRDTWAKMTSD